MKYDKETFREVLEPHHRTYWKIAYKKLQSDHIMPLAKEGDSVIDNLQLICKSCNTRKGPLDEDDFKYLMQWVEQLKDETKAYVLRKLAKGGRY